MSDSILLYYLSLNIKESKSIGLFAEPLHAAIKFLRDLISQRHLVGSAATIDEFFLQKFLVCLKLFEETTLSQLAVEFFLEVAGIVQRKIALVVAHTIQTHIPYFIQEEFSPSKLHKLLTDNFSGVLE